MAQKAANKGDSLHHHSVWPLGYSQMVYNKVWYNAQSKEKTTNALIIEKIRFPSIA